ncbi:restriction endonuclease subunit S [Candidatus Phytoplasma mali]|uniref:restriction endonuclease subunit S n=1 Tax=Apple proliferation phytoplasma TaxID=37692 RepID=UPI00130525CF|nr:restriction endonuclease subunit S [Candidatus Phytoplasma mali]
MNQNLRFKEFENTWKKQQLVDITEIQTGKVYPHSFSEGKYYIMNGGVKPLAFFCDQYNTNENTISITKAGFSSGYIHYHCKKFWIGNNCFKLININENNINTLFLYYYLKQNEKQIQSLKRGTSIMNLLKKDLYNFLIFSPSLKEQTKIATFLSLIDDKIKIEKELCNNFNYMKQYFLNQMFI